jgi:hypothetical protein
MMPSEKRIIAAITLIVCLMMAPSACNRAASHNAPQQHQPQASPAGMRSLIPAHFTQPQPLESLKPTMSPEKFTGKVRKAYQVAKEIPQTLTQLPCFCYCDNTFGHKSLHSCYEDEHSAGCATCLDSALLASELKQQGLGDAEIRDRLIAKYTKYSSPPGH